jgi:hypothetical protein
LNRNKIRKNIKLPFPEEEPINIKVNNIKKSGRGNSKNIKKEINFISQSEIESKLILEKQQQEEKEKEKAKEKKEENILNKEDTNEEKEKTKNIKKAKGGARNKKNVIEKENKNENKQADIDNATLELNEKNQEIKVQGNLTTNRKLDLSDENVEKIVPLLNDESQNNTVKDNLKFNELLEQNKENLKIKKAPKEKKQSAPKNHIKENKPLLEGDYALIINYKDILKKEKIENLDLLLLIFEICQNALKYDLKKSNKSKLFWDEVFLKPDFALIFKNFKSETLRKYWRVVTDTQNVKSFLETIQKYAEKINNPNLK